MNEDAEHFWELAKGFSNCMMVTQDGAQLRARPLAVFAEPELGEFRFLTRKSAHKVEEARQKPGVCLTFADPDSNTWLSVSGRAEVSEDRALIAQLWNPAAEAWFEGGPDQPDIAVLRVAPEYAEYWEGPSSAIGKVWQLAAGIFTSSRPGNGNTRLRL